MFFLRLKNCIRTIVAMGIFFSVLFCVACLRCIRFSDIEGERTLYLYSPSSQAVMKGDIAPLDLFFVKGESVSFSCEDRESVLENVLQAYGGEILFEEGAGDSHSYYCFTKKWTDGVILNGQFVNLHIAFNGECCTIGVPMIFGGF